MTLVKLRAEHCVTCSHSCRRQPSVNVELSGDYDVAVDLQLSTKDQLSLLFNSLILPLVGFLIAGSIAEWFGWNEPIIMFCTVAGFFIGIFLCRTKPSTLIKVKEEEFNSYQNQLNQSVKLRKAK